MYSSVSDKTLKILDSIVSEALRLATGAFKSTPVESLHILANEMPLILRRKMLSARYFIKKLSQLSNPAFTKAIPNTYGNMFTYRTVPPPFTIRARSILAKYNIGNLYIKLAFSYILNKTTIPSWLLPLLDISYDIADRQKKFTPDLIYRQKYTRQKGKYQGYIALFNDGSKSDEGVGEAAVCGNIERTASLPNIASIFSAELHAICLAVNIIREVTQDKYVIYTDSMDSLQSIEQSECTHPLVKKTQYDCIGLLESGKKVSFCWIPSH